MVLGALKIIHFVEGTYIYFRCQTIRPAY